MISTPIDRIIKRTLAGALLAAATAIPTAAQARFDQHPVYLPRPVTRVCAGPAQHPSHVRIEMKDRFAGSPGAPAPVRGRRAGRCAAPKGR